ncbi:MAG: hypothetical protein QOI66_4331 [Myxococcales bacterium]|nr:hypothetical protein [Myxococcales bacterium]
MLLVAAALLPLLASGAGCVHGPVAARGLALRKVVVYRNGIGYFERAGRVSGDRVQFRVRQNEVGDFLASLAVLERGGSSVRSASFPLSVDKLDPAPGDTRRSGLETVTMHLDGSHHDLQVGYIAETPVWRPSYRLVLDAWEAKATLQVWGIVQNLSGEDWNGVSLSLIAEAPLAFDASLATPVIPPRPTVTDGGDVIAVVPHSETSLSQQPPPPPPSAPMTMEAPAPMPMDDAPAEALADKAGRERRAMPMKKWDPARPPGAGQPAAPRTMVAAEPAFSRGSRNLSALAAVALQAGATRYDLAVPITLPDKNATMVLLMDKRVAGEAISLFAPDDGVPESASHPFRVARFTNTTGGLLEKGPLAIFSEGTDGGFLGQGMTDPLPVGATATVPFALERTVAVDKDRESRQEGARLYHIEAGTISIARDGVTLTRYRLRNGADHTAKLLVKHPRLAGARLEKPPAGTEDNVGAGSALVPANVGPHATVTLTVDERQQTITGVDWLSPLADDAVKAYLGDGRADKAVAEPLTAAWEIRKTLVKVSEEREKLAAEDADRRRATEETRANLKALEKNTAAGALRAKLAARLAADSARLDTIGKRLVELDLSLGEQRVRFNDAIRGIKLLASSFEVSKW